MRDIVADRLTPELACFELERRRMTESLRLFILGAWHVVEPGTVFQPGPHIDELIWHLERWARREIRNLVVNMPPRHMKSLTCSVFVPAWIWTWHPGAKFLCASYAQSLADDHSNLMRMLVTSEWYQSRWGDRVVMGHGRRQIRNFENKARGHRIATSVGGGGTGKGGDYIIADDPHNVRDGESDAKREAVLTWWDRVMSTRGNDPQTVGRLIVMQRVHEDDLSGHVMAERLGYEQVVLPAKFEGRLHPAIERALGPKAHPATISTLGRMDWRMEPGEPLWPSRFDTGQLAALERHLGAYSAAGQLQQRPSPSSGGLLKTTCFKRYGRRVLDAIRANPSKLDAWCTVWDTKAKDATRGSSYVCGQVWCRRGPDAFLVDSVRAKLDFMQTVSAVEDCHLRWPMAVPILVEAKASGPMVINVLELRIPAIQPTEPRGDKVQRARGASVYLESGNLWIPDEEIAPWVRDFTDECEMFPNGANDDQVDCLSSAVDHLFLGSCPDPSVWQGNIIRKPVDSGPVSAERHEQALELDRNRVRREREVFRRIRGVQMPDGETTFTGDYRGHLDSDE